MSEIVCPQCEHPCEETHKFCPVCGFPISEVVHKTDDPLINTTLPGGYVILELVGVGGMGRVYRAEQKALGRTVAVKIVHPHLLGDESASARFITEARAASRLNHPNSVGVIDFGKSSGGQLYLVMEFLRGRDLARVTYEDGYLSFPRIIDVMSQVLAALDEAHHLGIIHRDLKPENIVLEPMRSGGDFVKVVDFGLAKMKAEAQSTGITSPGLVCGTPDYMAPEQGRGDPIDARSDLYACGVILFQLLTGRLPFEAESPTQVVLMHLSAPPPNPRVVAPERDIPEIMVELTLKALSKAAKDRYQSAEEFIAALKAGLTILDRVSAAPTSAPTSDATIECGSCGALVPLGQKFCGECGSRVTAPPLHVAKSVQQRAVQGPSSQGVTFPLTFAGREDDVDWLDVHRFEVSTSVRAVRIVGDHGVGKTRILTEFLRTARDSGDTVVRTGPDPFWSEVGYYALRKAIAGLAGLPANGGKPADWANSTPEARHGLQAVFGQTDRVVEAPPPAWVPEAGELSIDGRRFMAAEALRWAIAKACDVAKKNRVILAIDDLHVIDGASRNAFADVINEPPLVGMLILGVHPPDFDPNWGGASRHLAGLPLAVAASLAKGMPPNRSNGSPGAHPEGKTVSPMHVEQLIRFNQEGGTDAAPRLGDIIANRIERLPLEGRRILQALAVIGDETEVGLLLEVMNGPSGPASSEPSALRFGSGASGSGAAGLGSAGTGSTGRTGSVSGQPVSTRTGEIVKILEEAGMILRCDGGTADGSDMLRQKLSTRHPLIRDVTLAMIPAGVKRDLHARAFADENGVPRNMPAEVLAMHAFHAQNAFEALMMLEGVANRATWRGDVQGAVMALRRAVELARREIFRGEIDDPMRAVLLFSRRLGEALARAGSLSDATGVLKEALDLTGPSGADRVQVLGALAFVARERARPNEAKKHLTEAIEIAKESLQGDLVDSLEKARREWRLP